MVPSATAHEASHLRHSKELRIGQDGEVEELDVVAGLRGHAHVPAHRALHPWAVQQRERGLDHEGVGGGVRADLLAPQVDLEPLLDCLETVSAAALEKVGDHASQVDVVRLSKLGRIGGVD